MISCKATKEDGTLVNDFNETLEEFINLHTKYNATIQTIKDINKPIIISLVRICKGPIMP